MIDQLLQSGFEFNAWLESYRHPALTVLFRALAFLGDSKGYILVIPVFVWFLSARLGTALLFGTYFSNVLNTAIKTWVALPRPFLTHSSLLPLEHPDSFSFPSGHAQLAGFFWTMLALRLHRSSVTVIALLSILGIGLSRVYLGAHYYFDVLGGWALGVLVAFGLESTRDRIEQIKAQLHQRKTAILWALAFGVFAALVPSEAMFISLGGIWGLIFAFHKGADQLHARFDAGLKQTSRAGRWLVGYAGIFVLLALFGGLNALPPVRVAIFFAFSVWGVWIVPHRFVVDPTPTQNR